jgi:DNA modification methylase
MEEFPHLQFDDFRVDMKPQRMTALLPVKEEEAEEDNFDPSTVRENIHGVEIGDIWQLGDHRLMCGDSTSLEQVEKLLNGNTAHMVFTDPPYNVDYGATMKDKLRGTDNRKIKNDNLGDDFKQFLTDAIGAFRPFVLGDVYVCMAGSELHTLYDPILYGWFEGSSHYWSGARDLSDVLSVDEAMTDDIGRVYLRVDNLSTDVWEFPKPVANKEHPTMKPVKLVERAIKNSSKSGDAVLDTFGGSGTTLIACEQLKRKCYTMELDPHYCSVIIERWQSFTGNEAVRLTIKEDGTTN